MINIYDLKSPKPARGYAIIRFLKEDEFLSLVDKVVDFNFIIEECYRYREINGFLEPPHQLPGIVVNIGNIHDKSFEFFNSIKKGSLVVLNRYAGTNINYLGENLFICAIDNIRYDISEILTRG